MRCSLRSGAFPPGPERPGLSHRLRTTDLGQSPRINALPCGTSVAIFSRPASIVKMLSQWLSQWLDVVSPLMSRNTSVWWLLVCGPGKQQQISIRIFDDEILGAPRLLFQCLAQGNTSRLKLKKQQLDLVRCSDGHRYRQQFLPITDRRLDYWSLDTP